MDVGELATPALLIERSRLDANLARMRGRARELGVTLRPHLKTAKSAAVALRAHGGRPGPITVSTLREAEYFAEHGFRDITYAVGIVPSRFPRVAGLLREGVDLKVVLDSIVVAEAAAAAARAGSLPGAAVLVEIDSGGGRAGIAANDPGLVRLAGVVDASPLRLEGVLTHAGQSYDCRDPTEVARVAEHERDTAVSAAQRLRGAGLPCPVVSVGSTPAALHAGDLAGVTEMRPGAYVFFDLAQCEMGSCDREAIALSVLATVIGHQRGAGHLLLDAGALALSRDRSAADRRPALGFGVCCDPRTLEPFGTLAVAAAQQEHGIVPVDDPAWFERLPIGATLRILPNHACVTAAAYERYVVVEGGRVLDSWDRVNGW